MKEKLKKERLKAEGKLLTEKQKHERRRAQQMLEAMRNQGMCCFVCVTTCSCICLIILIH